MELTIKTEENTDKSQVYKLNNLAFDQPDEADLVNNLRSTSAFVKSLSLVAFAGELLCGHILFTKILIRTHQAKEFESLALAPMAVHPDFQGKKIGTKLVQAGIAKARAMGFTSIIVLGHPGFYTKLGFVPASKWGIQAPFEVEDPAFMAMELVPNALANVQGKVIYAKEFGV